MPLLIIYLIILIALMALAYALTPSPKQPPQQGQKFQSPITEEGKLLGVVYGTVEIRDASVVNFWDLRVLKETVPVSGK
jgi:hypothetical protein